MRGRRDRDLCGPREEKSHFKVLMRRSGSCVHTRLFWCRLSFFVMVILRSLYRLSESKYRSCRDWTTCLLHSVLGFKTYPMQQQETNLIQPQQATSLTLPVDFTHQSPSSNQTRFRYSNNIPKSLLATIDRTVSNTRRFSDRRCAIICVVAIHFQRLIELWSSLRPQLLLSPCS